jgi:uncharacterized protein (TIGR00730 family)
MINDTEPKVKHLTIDNIKDGCITVKESNDEETKLCIVQEELRQGIDTITQFNPSVTFYGSARLKEDTEIYQKVRHLSYRISKELGFAILSGGGPGVMEAANRGGYDAGGKSVGLTIKLPHEQYTNPYVTDELPFYFFFTRQVSMHYATEACIFCPGGFGTLSELFEMLTLRQTEKIGEVPIILFGSEFWTPLSEKIKEILVEKYNTVDEKELSIFKITDDEEEILNIIKNSKIRDGSDELKG